MPRYLALEWDSHQARALLARTRGEGVVVEQAFSVALDAISREGEKAAAEIGQRIAAELSSRDIARVDTIVSVGRTSIELRRLSLPPAPDSELPELVRFQAMQQFVSIEEDWPLDFAPLLSQSDRASENEPASVEVLAAAISPNLVEQIKETCAAAGLSPRRLLLRPFAAASLFRGNKEDRCCLLIDLLADEADLTVVCRRQVVLTRTIRLPEKGGGEHRGRQLVGEIRRTIASAQNQLGGRRIDQLVLFGDGDENKSLQPTLEKELAYPVELYHPFEQPRIESDFALSELANPGRYASLLGMLLDETSGERFGIDFLQPRKKPEPPDKKLRRLLIGATVGCVLLLCAGVFLMKIRSLNAEIDQFQKELSALNRKTPAANIMISKVAEIDAFSAGDITWLDELRELSEEMPAAEEAIVRQLNFRARGDGGVILLEGAVRESSQVTQMEKSLRDPRHTVYGNGSQYDQNLLTHRWRFKTQINVAPQSDAAPPGKETATNGKVVSQTRKSEEKSP